MELSARGRRPLRAKRSYTQVGPSTPLHPKSPQSPGGLPTSGCRWQRLDPFEAAFWQSSPDLVVPWHRFAGGWDLACPFGPCVQDEGVGGRRQDQEAIRLNKAQVACRRLTHRFRFLALPRRTLHCYSLRDRRTTRLGESQVSIIRAMALCPLSHQLEMTPGTAWRIVLTSRAGRVRKGGSGIGRVQNLSVGFPRP
jgi:hypothetical protein